MERFLEKLGRFSVRFRWGMVLIWIFGTIAAVHFLPSLSSVVDTQNSAFLPSSQPSVQAANLEAPFQSTKASQALLVASAGGQPITGPEFELAILGAENAVRQIPGVTGVRDLATSANGEARLASVESSVPASGSAADNEVAAIRRVLAQNEFAGIAVPKGLTFNLAGTLAISADNAAANKQAQARTEALSYLIIIIILLLVYRSALAWLINLIPAGIVLALSEPVVGELAKHGLPASPITPVMMTVLILGAGTDYGLFLIMRFREEMEGGLKPHDAVVAAMHRVGESVVYAGLTVAGALFCLFISSFGIYKGLGPALAIGIVLMLIASITLTPALLAISGRATFWPSKVRTTGHKEGLWGRVAERCARRPGITLGIGVVILGLFALGCIGFTTTGFSGGTASPAKSDSAKGTAVLDANFPASVTNPTNVVFRFADSVWTSPGGLDTVAQAQALLAKSGQFKTITGALNPIGDKAKLTPAQLGELYKAFGPPGSLSPKPPSSMTSEQQQIYLFYRSTSQFVSADGRTVQFATTLPTGDPTSDASVNAVPAIRAATASVADAVHAEANGVYGVAPFSYDVKKVANQDLVKVFPVVALVIAVLLALLLRSLIAPIFLLLSVGISYFSTLGLTNLIFVHLGTQPGVNFVLPFMLFVFLVALGEDYNILVMSRIREESIEHGTEPNGIRTAVTNAVGATGTTVTSAGIILAGTFGAVGVAGGNAQLEEIGLALAIGILLDTFLVRTLLVPSTAQLLGRWTWWPSALSRAEKREGSGGAGPTGALATSTPGSDGTTGDGAGPTT